MSAAVIGLLRLGFLVLLWIFVAAVLITIKNDVFENRRTEKRRAKANPRPVESRPAKLVVSSGALAGTTLPLGKTAITVGRSPDSTRVLDDGYTSARHARFYQQGGVWFVEDLNSTNGTWVNNERIHTATRLSPNTTITIGKSSLELRQ